MAGLRLLTAPLVAALLPLAVSAAQPAATWPEADDPAVRACAPERVKLVAHAARTALPQAAAQAVLTSVCKPWPSQPAAEVFAVAFHEAARERVHLIVGVFPLAATTAPDWHAREIEEDATLDATQLRLRLDTARYALKPGTAAFGVDYHGGYQPNCGDGEPLAWRSLYAWQASQVQPVLQDLLLSSRRIAAGDRGRCADAGDAAAGQPTVIEDMRATIATAATSHHGWRDLVVTETRYRDDTPAIRRKTTRYTFDGRQYRRD